jgi:hypothetical protein
MDILVKGWRKVTRREVDLKKVRIILISNLVGRILLSRSKKNSNQLVDNESTTKSTNLYILTPYPK